MWTNSIVYNFWALFLSISTLHKVICNTFCEAGSGSAFFKHLVPDPHWEEQLDPDPQKMNADPQPYLSPSLPKKNRARQWRKKANGSWNIFPFQTFSVITHFWWNICPRNSCTQICFAFKLDPDPRWNCKLDMDPRKWIRTRSTIKIFYSLPVLTLVNLTPKKKPFVLNQFCESKKQKQIRIWLLLILLARMPWLTTFN